jgi:hypothetical protein
MTAANVAVAHVTRCPHKACPPLEIGDGGVADLVHFLSCLPSDWIACHATAASKKMAARPDRPPDGVFDTRIDIVTPEFPNSFFLYFDRGFTTADFYFRPRQFIFVTRVISGCHFRCHAESVVITAPPEPRESFGPFHPVIILTARVLSRDPQTAVAVFPPRILDAAQGRKAPQKASVPRSVVSVPEAPTPASSEQKRIARKKDKYRPFIEWAEEGILVDLKKFHDIPAPSHRLLLALALEVARSAEVNIDRDVRRRKYMLVGWINSHYDLFRGLVERFVITNPKGMDVAVAMGAAPSVEEVANQGE